jgi:hypothetical protein
MRVFVVLCLISIVPLSSALAADSDTHYVQYGDATQGPPNSMEYWDGGGYARTMLPMNLMDNGSNNRLNYSAPQDNSTPQCRADSSAPADSLIPHSTPAAPSPQGNNQNTLQP